MLRIDERLPETRLESEVVLHVRLHMRRAVRGQPRDPAALALLFGFGEASSAWKDAVKAADPMQAGAALAQSLRGSTETVVTLGHDEAHIAHCKNWLARRKTSDEVFAEIEASDLATLLELSKARDLAVAKGVDARGLERYLPILIQGPTGTGKELLADALHQLWKQKTKEPEAPFEVVHVGGMSADMINDELFGHGKGAFTGATSERVGRLEAANGGTLLIDEVGDLPREAQLRLLRFLQTQEVSRLGENKVRQLSVRVIAATWHDLDKNVADGRFREDLLHRLRVGAGLRLPPLASREGFFDELLPTLLTRRRHTAVPLVTRGVRDALARYHWPGNLRELAGVLDEIVALAEGDTIRLEHLPSHIQRPYLELPLHERAIGFLLDEVDGGGLPDDHVSWRIEQLTESLESSPVPAANEQLTAIGHFLALLDDTSEGHRHNVDEVNELLRLDQQRRRAAAAHAFWKSVASVDAPPNVRRLVREASKRAARNEAELQRQISSGELRAGFDANPWLRLFREIQALPVLRGANTGVLAETFVGLFNAIRLLAPNTIDTIREDAATGGFAPIWQRFLRFIRERSDDEGDPRIIDASSGSRSPAKRTREDWVTITESHSTQRAACEAVGIDPKTLAKYLEKHDIPNPWKRKRPA